MTDLGNGQHSGPTTTVPGPCIQAGRVSGDPASALAAAGLVAGPIGGSAGRIQAPPRGQLAARPPAGRPPAGRPLARPPAAQLPAQVAGQLAAQVADQPAPQAGPAISLAAPCSARVSVRGALDAALGGVRLSGRDRQFISRLVHWDKRNAASVVSLLWRARQAGRDEAALTPRQLDTVLAALGDAARYRTSGAAAARCWDCGNVPTGRCAEHARDGDRARCYAELAAALTGRGTPDGRPEPRKLTGYRRRAPVAS
jgi:hypothetical protein